MAISLAESGGDIRGAVNLAYRTTLGRAPTGQELDSAMTYVGNDPARMNGLAWMLFNLDDFIYVR